MATLRENLGKVSLESDSETHSADHKEFYRLLDDRNSSPTEMIDAYYKLKRLNKLEIDSELSRDANVISTSELDNQSQDAQRSYVNGHDSTSNVPEVHYSMSDVDKREDVDGADLSLNEWQHSENSQKWQREWELLIAEKKEFEEEMKSSTPMYSSEEFNERLRSHDPAKLHKKSKETAIKKNPRLAEWYHLANILAKGPIYAKQKKDTEAKEAAAALAKTAAAERSKATKGKGRK